MPSFRDHIPHRRNIIRTVTSHRDHRADLKTDFKARCGYCNSPDAWKTTYFEIDHFIPLKILTIKTSTDYSNLVYACRSCNNAKRKKWPTNDENIHNRNNEGFVDPCDIEYNSHFIRKDDGEIGYQTPLGEWMYHALKLHKPQHKVIWNLEYLQERITEMKNALGSKLDDHPVLRDELLKTYMAFDSYQQQFRSV
jgi:hypothetical protein